MIWQVITGEFPPQPGGVADYTQFVADGLAAAGDQVCVWAPRCAEGEIDHRGITVKRLPSHFGPRALAILNRGIGAAPGARILVQYVPHAFGMKAMNLPFCAWLYSQRRRDIAVMFHEVYFPIFPGQPLRHKAIGLATRAMARLAARAASRIFVSTPAWEPLLRPYLPRGRAVTWLPTFNNVPINDDAAGAAAMRREYAAGDLLLGHFGAYGAGVAGALARTLPDLMSADERVRVMLAGSGGAEFREAFLRDNPKLAERVKATGQLDAARLSLALRAADVMLQPYPDGVSARRTSVMAALAHGVAVVTNRGFATEPVWAESGAVALAPDGDYAAMGRLAAQLLADPAMRADYSSKARELYARRFDLKHTIEALRSHRCA